VSTSAAGVSAATAGQGFSMVGRRHELGLLLAALEKPPAVVFVEGEAGVGKSRLIQEAAAVLGSRGVRVVTGWCHPLREPLPFGPVLDALRGIRDWLPDPRRLSPQAGALAPLIPGLAEHLPPVPEAPADARTGRFQLVGAVRSVLEALGPLVLVVEDLHWVDEATRELLLLLGRDPPKQLRLVLTHRREDLPAGTPVLGVPYRRPAGTSGAEISLEPLTELDVQDLAGAALGTRAGAKLGTLLYQRSGGLPLVVEEDLLTLAGRKLPDAPDIPGPHRQSGTKPAAPECHETVLERSGVPRQLREAVTGRMAGLSARERQ
jgi:predicted ATPase